MSTLEDSARDLFVAALRDGRCADTWSAISEHQPVQVTSDGHVLIGAEIPR